MRMPTSLLTLPTRKNNTASPQQSHSNPKTIPQQSLSDLAASRQQYDSKPLCSTWILQGKADIKSTSKCHQNTLKASPKLPKIAQQNALNAPLGPPRDRIPTMEPPFPFLGNHMGTILEPNGLPGAS